MPSLPTPVRSQELHCRQSDKPMRKLRRVSPKSAPTGSASRQISPATQVRTLKSRLSCLKVVETFRAAMQLIAVIIGGLIAITGGFLSTMLLERQRARRDSRNLALAFSGEITAVLKSIKERNYEERFTQVINQIEETGMPFYMPFRVRFKYDRVYEANVSRIGLLELPLPEEIPLFYTCLTSILEDLVSLGDGTYSQLELALLLRIYRDPGPQSTVLSHRERASSRPLRTPTEPDRLITSATAR